MRDRDNLNGSIPQSHFHQGTKGSGESEMDKPALLRIECSFVFLEPLDVNVVDDRISPTFRVKVR